MNIFFTSDTHFGHKKIIDYCKRPFGSVEEMDNALIENWNSCVSEGDIVYHLGDFAWSGREVEYLEQLNGEIWLVPGNHDPYPSVAYEAKMAYWSDDLRLKVSLLPRIHKMKIQKQLIILCHYPMLIWDESHYGSWHLYGHLHGTLPQSLNLKSMDVGVDSNNYTPVSFERVSEVMAEKNHVVWSNRLPGFEQLVEDTIEETLDV